MASVCLTVLTNSATDNRCNQNQSQPGRFKLAMPFGPGPPLLHYAQGWFLHVRLADAGEVELYQTDERFLDSVATFSADLAEDWIRGFNGLAFNIPVGNKAMDLRKVSREIRRAPFMLFAALGLAGYLRLMFEDDPSLFRNLMEKTEGMLTMAVEYGHHDFCKLILEAGAKMHINTVIGGHTNSPIHIAAYDGRPDLVELLLANGADANYQQGTFDSPLQAAASGEGSSEAAMLLLDAGAQINMPSSTFGSALQCVVHLEHQDMVKLLISRGADPNLEGGFWGTPVIAAVLGKPSALVPLVEAGADVNKVAGFHGTALQLAVHLGLSAMIDLLLDQGADPNVRGGYFGSALEAASWIEDAQGYPVMKTLLNRGARIYPDGDYGPRLYKFLAELDDPESREKRGDYSSLEPWKTLSPMLTDHVAYSIPVRNSRSRWHEMLSGTRGRVAALDVEALDTECKALEMA